MLVPLLLSEAGLGPASVVAKLVDGSFVLGSRLLYMWPTGHQKKADRRAGPHPSLFSHFKAATVRFQTGYRLIPHETRGAVAGEGGAQLAQVSGRGVGIHTLQ